MMDLLNQFPGCTSFEVHYPAIGENTEQGLVGIEPKVALSQKGETYTIRAQYTFPTEDLQGTETWGIGDFFPDGPEACPVGQVQLDPMFPEYRNVLRVQAHDLPEALSWVADRMAAAKFPSRSDRNSLFY